jgi:hypothetical protein
MIGICVVTAEDIKQLGATQLGEALRMVVAVHFEYTNYSYMVAGKATRRQLVATMGRW